MRDHATSAAVPAEIPECWRPLTVAQLGLVSVAGIAISAEHI